MAKWWYFNKNIMSADKISLNAKLVLSYFISIRYACGEDTFLTNYYYVWRAFKISLKAYIRALEILQENGYIAYWVLEENRVLSLQSNHCQCKVSLLVDKIRQDFK